MPRTSQPSANDGGIPDEPRPTRPPVRVVPTRCVARDSHEDRRRWPRHGGPQVPREPRRDRRVARAEVTVLVRGAAPRLRPGAPVRVLLPASRPTTCRWSSPASSSAPASACASAARAVAIERREAHRHHRRRRGAALRQAGARHRLHALRAAGAGARAAALLRLPHHRGPGGDEGLRRATSSSGVVVGGGLLGLECAKALRDMGLETHVVEFAPRLMAVQVDEGGGRVLRARIEELGVHVHTSRNTVEIVDGASGAPSHGVRRRHAPRDRHDRVLRRHPPARRAGAPGVLAIGPRGGVAIDSTLPHQRPQRLRDRRMRRRGTSRSSAWSRPATTWPAWPRSHIAGEADAAFTGADMSTKLKLMGVDVASIGDAHGRTPTAAPSSTSTSGEQVYKKIVVSEDGKQLLGAVLVGDAAEYGTLAADGAERHRRCRPTPEFLILPSSDGKAKPGLGVDALPDSGADLLVQQRHQGPASARRWAKAPARVGRDEGLHQGRRHLRRLRAAGHPGDEGRDEQARHGGEQPPLRALRLLAPGALPPGARGRDPHLRRAAGARTARAWAATSASRRRRASSPRAGTSSC